MILAGGPMEDKERIALIEQYIALCTRYQMTHAAEYKLANEYFEDLRKEMSGFPTVPSQSH